MNEILKVKLAELPSGPGVYFHKGANGEILYIGKAANLKARVRQYFHKSRMRDPKTDALVAEIRDIEWRTVETELDALFLEAELIRRYLPPYNILLRDDKSLVYVRINSKDPHPTVTLTRRPLDDSADYLGPYFSAITVKRALKALRKAFPYSTHMSSIPKRECLQAHLGLCPGLEAGKTSLSSYRKNLARLKKYLKGERKQLVKDLEKEMHEYAKKSQFEKAAAIRNQISALKNLSHQVVFSDRESMDLSKDYGLNGLYELLGLEDVPRRIEGYDISHMQGTDTVASMVVFTNGVPDKSSYRKFKMRIPGNDDFAHMEEVIKRRLTDKNIKAWGRPDLILIDGGKGQLSAATKSRNQAGYEIPMVGLVKREEQIVVSNESHITLDDAWITSHNGWVTKGETFVTIQLPVTNHIVKLLQRIRDESHRFAVSYHSTLKKNRQSISMLDEIPSVGPATKRKLLKTFGSLQGISKAPLSEVEQAVGPKKAAIIKQYVRLKNDQKSDAV